MFAQLFKRPHAVARHRDGPLAESRRRYLVHLAEQGVASPTLLVVAVYLRAVTRYLHLDKPDREQISLSEIEAAATRWAKRRPCPKTAKRRFARPRFIRVAKRWLLFLGRLQLPVVAPRLYSDRIEAFADFQREKGFAAQTIMSRSRVVQRFLDRLCAAGRRLEELTASQVDDALIDAARESDLARVSVRDYAECLRAFFRYAETCGWCRKGLAAAIMAPRVYAQESIPVGPSWDDLRRLLATTEGDGPTNIRDRALLLLLIVYGFRNGEVCRLQLDDLNWEQELICIKRSKSHRTQVFPLSRAVGEAILRYIKEVRPRSSHREVFLALNAPVRPLFRRSWPRGFAPWAFHCRITARTPFDMPAPRTSWHRGTP